MLIIINFLRSSVCHPMTHFTLLAEVRMITIIHTSYFLGVFQCFRVQNFVRYAVIMISTLWSQ